MLAGRGIRQLELALHSGPGVMARQTGVCLQLRTLLPAPLQLYWLCTLPCPAAHAPPTMRPALPCSPCATFVDPTVHAKSRWEAALGFFYPLQHLFSRVDVSGITLPQLALVPQRQGPPLLQARSAEGRGCFFGAAGAAQPPLMPR